MVQLHSVKEPSPPAALGLAIMYGEDQLYLFKAVCPLYFCLDILKTKSNLPRQSSVKSALAMFHFYFLLCERALGMETIYTVEVEDQLWFKQWFTSVHVNGLTDYL